MDNPRLLSRHRWFGKYRAVRCALCYHWLWPWQRRIAGANYFPHPYMICHLGHALAYEREMVSNGA